MAVSVRLRSHPSIHPSIHPRLRMNSSRRQKTCRRASASTIIISNLYCGECTPPLTSIHPSIHPRLSTNSSWRQKIFSERKNMRTKRLKIYGGECTPPLTPIHPSKESFGQTLSGKDEYATARDETNRVLMLSLISCRHAQASRATLGPW